MRRSPSTLAGLALALAVPVLVLSCRESDPPLSVVDGGCAEVYGGQVCTWAEMQDQRVVRLGATVPMATIANAPADAEMAWPPVEVATIALPEAAQAAVGVQNLKMYWEAHGHPPGPYLVPHFDFHFYTISPDEVDAIECSDASKPATLPAGYQLPDIDIPEIGNLVGLCVPQMGMHALLESELTGPDPFTGTMVIGYYKGAPIFFEPMLTQNLLMQENTFTLPIPDVAGIRPGVLFPSVFEAQYDSASSSYRFVFSGFEPEVVVSIADQ